MKESPRDLPFDTHPGNANSDRAAIRLEGFATAHRAEQNRLLAALPLEDYALLLPQLIPMRLRLKQILIEPEQPIKDVFFIREGVGSIVTADREDETVEIGIVGNEGFIGLPRLFGQPTMPNRVLVQVEGEAWRMDSAGFGRIVEKLPVLRRLLLRYAQYFMVQVSQTAGCNRLHSLDERCARWLLMIVERMEVPDFAITQEYLAIMLGVRRAGVTVAMGTLQAAGIVETTRGRVVILDLARLEEAACGCYRVTKRELDRVWENSSSGPHLMRGVGREP
jgi:CRP-like cAMP-binding protein